MLFVRIVLVTPNEAVGLLEDAGVEGGLGERLARLRVVDAGQAVPLEIGFAGDAVNTTVGSASSIRIASSAAAKPPNTTEWMAPRRAQASMAITAWGTMGM